eukprot:SAG22_NODE_2524_length_2477_cov_1.834735_1_plen_256_part_00
MRQVTKTFQIRKTEYKKMQEGDAVKVSHLLSTTGEPRDALLCSQVNSGFAGYSSKNKLLGTGQHGSFVIIGLIMMAFPLSMWITCGYNLFLGLYAVAVLFCSQCCWFCCGRGLRDARVEGDTQDVTDEQGQSALMGEVQSTANPASESATVGATISRGLVPRLSSFKQPKAQAMLMMQVTCPAGATGGAIIPISTPSGKVMQVEVPAGVVPGVIFQVQVPAAADSCICGGVCDRCRPAVAAPGNETNETLSSSLL